MLSIWSTASVARSGRVPRLPHRRHCRALARRRVTAPAASEAFPNRKEKVMTHLIEGPQGRLSVTRRKGVGLPVLFLHGDSSRASQWDAVIDLLPEEIG